MPGGGGNRRLRLRSWRDSAEFAARGRTLVAKAPEIQNQGSFAKTAFQIDLEAGTCTCPNQQQTHDFRAAKGGGGMFVFATEMCATCPLRSECTRGQGGRTVHVHPQEVLLQRAREFHASPAFDEARQRRQVVEHRIARLAQLGIRQARYFGRTKTLFQVCLAAAVANLTLLATTSSAGSTDASVTLGTLLVVLAGILGLTRHRFQLPSIALSRDFSNPFGQPPAHFHAIIRPLLPPCRPGF